MGLFPHLFVVYARFMRRFVKWSYQVKTKKRISSIYKPFSAERVGKGVEK